MTDPSIVVASLSSQPLAAIREKERVLAEAIRRAHEQAQARIAEARARANAIKEQAERDSVQEAEKFYQDGIVTAREQVHTIRLEGDSAATRLHEHGTARISEAAEYIVQFVLPRSEKTKGD